MTKAKRRPLLQTILEKTMSRALNLAMAPSLGKK